MYDPLILVYCRHTWSCSLGSPSMLEVSCDPSELCCHVHLTQQKPDRYSTHSGSKSSKTTCSKNTKAQVHPIHWWLDERIPWQIHWNWQAPGWIQDMTVSRCSSSHTCTQKMPQLHYVPRSRKPGKNGGPGRNYPHRPAHRLGIIDYLCTKGKWWALLVSRSTWSQQSNPPWSSQDAYCRSCTQIWKFMLLHQARCTSWILVNSPWWRIKPLNYLQQPLWEVPFPAPSLWSGLFTRHLEEDGPVPWRVPRCIGIANDITVHGCTEAETWCPSAEPHVGSPQVWSCVQSTENACKGPSHKLLGCLYGANGVHPDPEKVNAVYALPAPTNVTDLQEFLSMVTYLSPFICGLSTLTAPLWELLK